MFFDEQILIPALHPIYRMFHVSLLENGHVVLEKTHKDYQCIFVITSF